MVDYNAKTVDGLPVYIGGSCGLPANRFADKNCKLCNGDGILDAGEWFAIMVDCDCCKLRTEQEAVKQMPIPKGLTRNIEEALTTEWYLVAILAEAISAVQQYEFKPVIRDHGRWVAAMHIAEIPFYLKKIVDTASSPIPVTTSPDHRSHHGAQAHDPKER